MYIILKSSTLAIGFGVLGASRVELAKDEGALNCSFEIESLAVNEDQHR